MAAYARIAKQLQTEAQKPNSVAARAKEQHQAVRAAVAAEQQRHREAAVEIAAELTRARKAEEARIEAENRIRELAESQHAAEQRRQQAAERARAAQAQAAARAEGQRMLKQELDTMEEPKDEPRSWRTRLEWDDELRRCRRPPLGQQAAALDAARQPGETDAAVAQRMLDELRLARREVLPNVVN